MPTSDEENKNLNSLNPVEDTISDAKNSSYREIPLTPINRNKATPESVDVKPDPKNPGADDEILKNTEEVRKEKTSARTLSQLDNKPKELTVTTLINLLGLPTSKQITLLDSKMDLVLTKFSTLQRTTENLYNQMSQFEANSQSERIEFRVNEILSIMKKFFPLAFKVEGGSAVESQESRPKTNILKNSTKPVETKIHQDVLESNEGPPKKIMTDEEYQNDESSKLKQEMMEKYKN